MEVVFAFFATTTCNLSENLTSLKEYTVLDPLCFWKLAQHGETRADYGKGLLKELATRLTTDFGKGFDESNLRYMRLFYRCFPNCDTLRHELTWSHYRRLISVEDEKARLWYMNEAADSVWSTRQMDRQISNYIMSVFLLAGKKSLLWLKLKRN